MLSTYVGKNIVGECGQKSYPRTWIKMLYMNAFKMLSMWIKVLALNVDKNIIHEYE